MLPHMIGPIFISCWRGATEQEYNAVKLEKGPMKFYDIEMFIQQPIPSLGLSMDTAKHLLVRTYTEMVDILYTSWYIYIYMYI